ncbi:hypothetical protein TVAG_413430 [Trichomonas vaginalis G3]|uniref:Uncharacterized protein n=1 Tax=Trichomonas vaginalis (strain ATCC PRA-98 / G3) TaxID=412133 RepID=A2F9H5_TRIV3|nr:zebrafish dkey-56m19.5 family [Trichomonas vaginalis G3]EAX98446.1 hypothetical protein TVAG_413430 [Trichomonas vaginalis G3]KAI5493720.1 zebrafish dkey-56m19.5 family [Trichomonas vaginalis G3]|eukprot:XP_001311376.1 hypothetical protein [Trichomonas vaginalis G3]
MSEKEIDANQTKSSEIYEKIVEYVNKKLDNYEALEFYLNSGSINKNTQENILSDIYKIKDLHNIYKNLLDTVKLPENPILQVENTYLYEPIFSEVENHSFGFVEPQIRYSYIVYLLNEIDKQDKNYYLAFYELSKFMNINPWLIFNFEKTTTRIFRSNARRDLYAAYSSSPELLSWRNWMRALEEDKSKITFHMYNVFAYVYYLAETYSYDIPIVFEEVNPKFINLFTKEIFDVEKINLDGKNVTFAEYYEMIKKANPNLSESKLNNIKDLCLEYEITKNPNPTFLKLYLEQNPLAELELRVFKPIPNFIRCLKSDTFCLAHVLFYLCYCLELIRVVPQLDDVLETIEYYSDLASTYYYNKFFNDFNVKLLNHVTFSTYYKSDNLKPFFDIWKFFYEKFKDTYYDTFEDAMATLLKVMSRAGQCTIKEIAEEIRESESSTIFALDYDDILPENMKVMRQLTYEYNQLNDDLKAKTFEKLTNLHSSELWLDSIEFLKKYYDDKRMTIGILKALLKGSKTEVAQEKELKLEDYLEKNNAPSDPNYHKYIQIQMHRIMYSNENYLVSEAKKFNLEALYLISEYSISVEILMKKIFSRKFYIFDDILFNLETACLFNEINLQADSKIPIPGVDYKPGIDEFEFCQLIINMYPIDIKLCFPVCEAKYDKSILNLLQGSSYLLEPLQNQFDFSNYKFYKCVDFEFASIYNKCIKNISRFVVNQNFREALDLPINLSTVDNKLKYLIPSYFASWNCIKKPEKMKEETKQFIIDVLNNDGFNSVLLSDLLRSKSATSDNNYLIFDQILENQENQFETFSKFYRILEMFENKIDPSSQENFEILESFDFSKYGNVAIKYKEFQSHVISNNQMKPEYFNLIIKEKKTNYQVIKFFIDEEIICLKDLSADILKLLIKVTEQEEVKENNQFEKVQIKPVDSDLDISWILDLVEYSNKVKFIYSLRTYDFINIYKSMQKNDKKEVDLTKEFLKTGNSKVLDSYENEVSEKYFDTFVVHHEFFNTNNLIKYINNLSLPFKELNEKSIDILNQLICNFRSDLEINVPLSNFFYFFKHCQEIFPFLSEIDGFWNYKPPKYQSFAGFIKDINKMINKKKIPQDLSKLQEFCNSFDSKEENLYLDDSNDEKVTVGLIIMRLLQNSNAYDCNMKIFSEYFKERREEQKVKINKQKNLSEFYFNLQKELESKEKIHNTKISIINDINDDLPEKMTKERFSLFEKLLNVDKKKWKLIENSFLDVFTFCEENSLLRYQEQIIGFTLKCIEENNNVFFTNPRKELYNFILDQISNEKQNEFSGIYKLNKENDEKISTIKSNMKQEVINALKTEFESSRNMEIKQKLELYSSCFHKIVKNVPLLMVKPKFESVDYSFDKIKFYNMILSYNQMNLDLSNEEVNEYDFVFQEKGNMIVKNTKTNKTHRYSQTQCPHLYAIVNNSIDKSFFKFEISNPTWIKVRIPKNRKKNGDFSFEILYNLHKELENLLKTSKLEENNVFGKSYIEFEQFLDKISDIKVEKFSENFQKHMKTINLDSSFPKTFNVFEKFINMSKEIKSINVNKNLTKTIKGKLRKLKEIDLPNTNDQKRRNFCFRLQTKFTPKIVVTESGINPNFSQIYFYNFNANFDTLEIFILIEGSFQFLDVSIESSSNSIKTEVVEDKIILVVDLSSKPNKVEGILNVSSIKIPISLCFKYDKFNINGPDFVFSNLRSDLDFRSAKVESIITDEMTKIIDLIDSYKTMSDKFSNLFFSYLKSNQYSFPINLLRIFSNLYSLHEFFVTHTIDSFCPYYFAAQEFETSICRLLRVLSIDESSEEENFDFYKIFCYKTSNDSIVNDPNVKRNESQSNQKDIEDKEQVIENEKAQLINEEKSANKEQGNEEKIEQDVVNINQNEEFNPSNQDKTEEEGAKSSPNLDQSNNLANSSNDKQNERITETQNTIKNENDSREEKTFNSMQNNFMQMPQQNQFQMPPQFQRMIPPQIQNNPQAILQYQQIQNQYQSIQMQILAVQQSAFQFYQQNGVNSINDILMPNGGYFYPPNMFIPNQNFGVPQFQTPMTANHQQDFIRQQQQPKM